MYVERMAQLCTCSCNLHASQTDTRPGALRFGLASKGWESFDWRHDRPGTLRGFFLVESGDNRSRSDHPPLLRTHHNPRLDCVHPKLALIDNCGFVYVQQ